MTRYPTLADFLRSPILTIMGPQPLHGAALPPEVVARLVAFDDQKARLIEQLRVRLGALVKLRCTLVTARHSETGPQLVTDSLRIHVGFPHIDPDEVMPANQDNSQSAHSLMSGIPEADYLAQPKWDQEVTALSSALGYLGVKTCTLTPSVARPASG